VREVGGLHSENVLLLLQCSDIKTDLLMEDVKLQDVDNIWVDVQGTTRLGLLGDAAKDLKMLVSLES